MQDTGRGCSGYEYGLRGSGGQSHGMKICGISCISNLACGMTDVPLSHKEVQEASDKMALSSKTGIRVHQKTGAYLNFYEKLKKRHSKIVFFVVICNADKGRGNMLPVLA